MDKIVELIKSCRNSSFNRTPYRVNISFHRFPDNLALHCDYDGIFISSEKNKFAPSESIDFSEYLKKITPEFQRANNKWNKGMKVKFIENLLKGVKTEILLYRFKEEEDSQIIDGLQRTTAIFDFFQGKIKPFGYSYKDLKDNLSNFQVNIAINIYTFSSWEEVGRFYIDMNENITHSKADIQKAKDWFLKEKNIIL
jgi:hypothetical protein